MSSNKKNLTWSVQPCVTIQNQWTVLSVVFILYNTSFFPLLESEKEDDICMSQRESSSVPISSEWIDLDPPPSQLFLQFVTVLLYTGFPLEQMWPSTVVWPLRYFMLNRHKVTCVSYLEEWALLFFMLVTSTNSHRYKTKSKF